MQTILLTIVKGPTECNNGLSSEPIYTNRKLDGLGIAAEIIFYAKHKKDCSG
jgi:hypothetical protein